MGVGIGDLTGSQVIRTAPTLHTIGLGVLRFGDVNGNLSADDYDWEHGICYGSSQSNCGGPIGAAGNQFAGFLRFARQVGAQPLIVVNGEVDDPQQAARQVTYFLRHWAPAAQRNKGGEAACVPTYWEIGNTPITWQHFAVPLTSRGAADVSGIQPDQYAALVIAYASAMRRVDPCIKIVADEWITGATDQAWVDYVSAVDTHYAPVLYSLSDPQPSAAAIIGAVENRFTAGRQGLDFWLQDLRDSLGQFTNSAGIGIIVGQWSIDGRFPVLGEPPIYGTYVQAVFTAEMVTHFYQDARSRGPNPLLMAVQYPITGSGQEPFNLSGAQPRPAVGVYTLLSHFGAHPIPIVLGANARQAGIEAAAAQTSGGSISLLTVNTNASQPYTLRLQGIAAAAHDIWWIQPDANLAVSTIHHAYLVGSSIILPPWAIAVVGADQP
jgi:hypothetical protein